MTSLSAFPADHALESRLRRAIRDIPDYPKPGIVFKDITPLLGDPQLFADACRAMAAPYRDGAVTHVAAIESRGFLFGGPVAQLLGAGVAPVRKRGKLPYRAEREDYALEYGVDSLEMHVDALPTGARVLVVDDVLATGGTAAAASDTGRWARLLETSMTPSSAESAAPNAMLSMAPFKRYSSSARPAVLPDIGKLTMSVVLPGMAEVTSLPVQRTPQRSL